MRPATALFSLFTLIFLQPIGAAGSGTVTTTAIANQAVFTSNGVLEPLITGIDKTLPLNQQDVSPDISDDLDISLSVPAPDNGEELSHPDPEQSEEPLPVSELQSRVSGLQSQSFTANDDEPDLAPSHEGPSNSAALEQNDEFDVGAQPLPGNNEASASPEAMPEFSVESSPLGDDSESDDTTVITIPLPSIAGDSSSRPESRSDGIEVGIVSADISKDQMSEKNASDIVISITTDTPIAEHTFSLPSSSLLPSSVIGFGGGPKSESEDQDDRDDDSDMIITPTLLPSPYPYPYLEEDVAPAIPSMSPEEGEDEIWVEIPLSVSNADNTFGLDVDDSIRSFASNTTESSPRDWRLVDLSQPESGSMQRQQSTAFLVTYHAQLPRQDAGEQVATLEKGITGGDLNAFLRDRIDDQTLSIKFARAPLLDVEPANDIADGTGPLLPESGKDPNSPAEGPPEDSKEGFGSSSDQDANDRGKRFGIILASSLTGLVLVCAALVVFVHYCRKDRGQDHLLDGVVEIPSPVASPTSSRTNSESSRFNTGAPIQPRGPTVLRNQARILDWQREWHVEALSESTLSPGCTGRATSVQRSGNAEGGPYDTVSESLSNEIID